MSIARLLAQTATIYPKTGYNKYGRDLSGVTGVVAPCRFENRTKTRINKQGQEVQIVGTVFLKGDVVVNTEDRILISSISYKVFSINGDINARGEQVLIEAEVEKWQTT